MNKSFEFKQCVILLKSTGEKAGDLLGLREGIASVRDESIYHHTFQYYLKGLIREYTNDFAHWVGESLEERALSEQLSNIDPYGFGSIKELRKRLLAVIDAYLAESPAPRPARPRDEFHFGEAVTLVFPLGIQARNLAEFLMGVKYVDDQSLYYHFFEARNRLGGGADDFTNWIMKSLRKGELARHIRTIDPFMHSIAGIREHLMEAVENAVKRDMAIVGVES